MSTVIPSSTPRVDTYPAPRIVSIDVFRGLTIMVMIFVNDLASVHGLPWWTYHMAANIDAMTYVDMVFPCFLFIVGMSIPLAIKQRLKRSNSQFSLWSHILLRAAALLILGLILANAEKADSSRMGISSNLWGVLGILGAILLWGVFGDGRQHKGPFRALRVCGFVLVVAMYAIFRRTTDSGHVAWIDPSYPEILGLIAFTYIAACILYVPTRRWLWAPVAWFCILVAFNALCADGLVAFPNDAPLYLWPFGNGAMASVTMAGVVTCSIFLGEHRWRESSHKIWLALSFAALTLVAGRLLTPLGISKIRATPTWCLYSIGASVLIFTALYLVCDVKKQTSWAMFLRPAGSNTLLTYLLPDLYYFLIALVGLSYPGYLNAGWPGVLRSVIFTVLMLALAALVTRSKIRMQL